MKAILASAFLAVGGFALAACGSSPKVGAGAQTFTSPTTTTLSHVDAGQKIRCEANGISAAAVVPKSGNVAGFADGANGPADIKLERQIDGSLIVTCGP